MAIPEVLHEMASPHSPHMQFLPTIPPPPPPFLHSFNLFEVNFFSPPPHTPHPTWSTWGGHFVQDIMKIGPNILFGEHFGHFLAIYMPRGPRKNVHGGGGIVVGGPPPKNCRKLRGNCGKIAVFSKGNCGRDLENFRFPDSGQWKVRQKITSPNQAKTQQKFFFSHFCGQFSQILITNGYLKQKLWILNHILQFWTPSENCGFKYFHKIAVAPQKLRKIAEKLRKLRKNCGKLRKNCGPQSPPPEVSQTYLFLTTPGGGGVTFKISKPLTHSEKSTQSLLPGGEGRPKTQSLFFGPKFSKKIKINLFFWTLL